jgi:hypothetical protein
MIAGVLTPWWRSSRKKIGARAVGQHVVEDDEIERAVLDGLAGLVEAVADHGAATLFLHGHRDQLGTVQIIFEDQAGESRVLA